VQLGKKKRYTDRIEELKKGRSGRRSEKKGGPLGVWSSNKVEVSIQRNTTREGLCLNNWTKDDERQKWAIWLTAIHWRCAVSGVARIPGLDNGGSS